MLSGIMDHNNIVYVLIFENIIYVLIFENTVSLYHLVSDLPETKCSHSLNIFAVYLLKLLLSQAYHLVVTFEVEHTAISATTEFC